MRPFAHASEQRFAAFLDQCHINYAYEAQSFPLARDANGQVTEAVTPDFFLPDYGLYVEITTLKQALVTRKNKKLRKLQALYPDVRVKILYRKQVEALLERYKL